MSNIFGLYVAIFAYDVVSMRCCALFDFLGWFVAAVKCSPNKYEGFLCPTESGNGWLPVEIASSSVRYEIEISH